MTDPPEPKRSSATVVKCEKHGLHYDAAKTAGCVLCRREAGGSPSRTTAPASGGSLGLALGVTAVLLVMTTLGLYLAHHVVVEVWKERNRPPLSFDPGKKINAKDLGLPDSFNATDFPAARNPDGD